MKRPIRRRADDAANDYGWEYNYQGRKTYQRDGYEIYFFSKDDGFELTIRDPETMERKAVLSVRDVPTGSPLYAAIIEHILANVEEVVNECLDEQH